MKYPKNQQIVFEQFCRELATYADIKQINPHTLHFICFQQFSEGQKHNWIYCTESGLKKAFNLSDNEEAVKLFQSDFDFELYPQGCNDNHIETMVKYTLKNMGL